LGLSPDMIVCRSASMLEDSTKSKISTFCHVAPAQIISVHDVSNIYHVPLILAQQGVHTIVKRALGLHSMMDTPDLASWSSLAHTVDNFKRSVDIALVGKYVGLEDAYLSVTKALSHASMHLNVDIKIKWVEAAHLAEDTKASDISKYDAAWAVLRAPSLGGILVPGGFGIRGIEGMVAATNFARTKKIPFLGICLGMQVMVIEYARSVLKYSKANSAEFDDATPHPVIVFMPEINAKVMGGTMRLGARTTHVSTTLNGFQKQAMINGASASASAASASVVGTPTSKSASATTFGAASGAAHSARSLAAEVYGYQASSPDTFESILERHRHRYEVNPAEVAALEGGGLYFTGRDDKGERMEIAELPRAEHPHFLGTFWSILNKTSL
jgi:CTP synthase